MRTHADAESLLSRTRRPRHEDLRAAFVEELVAHRYSQSLVGQAERILPRLFAWLHRRRVRDIRAVDETHMVAFLRDLKRKNTARGTPPAPQTMLNYRNIVRRFFAASPRLQDAGRAHLRRRRRHRLAEPGRHLHGAGSARRGPRRVRPRFNTFLDKS